MYESPNVSTSSSTFVLFCIVIVTIGHFIILSVLVGVKWRAVVALITFP